jgi:microcystin-dependent protein
MPDPRDYHHWLGEIRMFASEHLPPGWVPCDGQTLPIAEHRDLFDLMGTAFGGDGSTTFGMPDFRGRVPVQAGEEHAFATSGGSEKVPLADEHLPAHTHVLRGSTDAATHQSIARGVPATSAGTGTTSAYAPDVVWRGIDPSSISESGRGEPHENMARFSCLNFAVCTVGTWPTQDPPDPPPPPPIDDAYVGEVRMWALNFPPRGWMHCNGEALRVQDYSGLFRVLRFNFGGRADRFNLPLIDGAVPIHAGQGAGLTARTVGQQAGANEATLTEAQMGPHRHALQVSGDPAVASSPEGLGFAVGDNIRMYGKREGYPVDLARAALEPAGTGKSHNNLQPYLPVHFYICTEGVVGGAPAA